MELATEDLLKVKGMDLKITEPVKGIGNPKADQVHRTGGLTIQDQEELQHLKWKRTCKVCLKEVVQVVLIPCGHLVCEECSSKLPSCPLCGGQIQQRLNISFS